MLEKAIENRIIEIVEEETRIYQEILSLSEEKRRILVEGKAAELDMVVRSEQKLSGEIVKLEKERDELLTSAVNSGSITKEDMIISKLMQKMSTGAAKRASELSTELTDILMKLKQVNDINGELIKQSLDYIEYTVNIMSSTGMATNLTYGGGAGPVDPKKPGSKKTFFDSKV